MLGSRRWRQHAHRSKQKIGFDFAAWFLTCFTCNGSRKRLILAISSDVKRETSDAGCVRLLGIF